MNKKKIVIASAAGLVAVSLLVGFTTSRPMGMGTGASAPAASGAPTVRTVTLEKGDIRSTVSATGTVYSVSSVNVYSSLNYPVQTVHVSVGDMVNEGDLLAELDTTSLEADISQKQAQVWASQSTAQQNLKTAQQDLETYRKNLDENMESSLLSAEKAVATAESNLAAAKLDVETANNDLATARRNHREYRDGETDDDSEYSDSQLRDLLNTVSQKEIALEKAQNTLATREADLESAQTDLEVAREKSSETLRTYEDKVTSAKLNNNYNADYISIQKLQGDVEDCRIVAPVSGTVTAVNAIEGSTGNGLLFVIQDTEGLKVLTNIKEYDVGNVTLGDPVIIKTDATGDTEFSGSLTKIAPTSTLTATGETTSSTEAEYEAEVTVSEGTAGLLIGMNARLSVVTEEHANVFSVPFEAVESVDGSSWIYVQTTGENGATYRKIPVETGLETNLYVEIGGEGLEEGMQVVKSASTVDQSLVSDQSSDMSLGSSGPESRPDSGEAAQ